MKIRWEDLSQISAWLATGLYINSSFSAGIDGDIAGLSVFAKADWSLFLSLMEVL